MDTHRVDDVRPDPNPTDTRIDRRIGDRYEVRRVIGRGGMAVVLDAFDTEAGTPVAIKVLRLNLGDEPLDRRLIQELLAAAAVQHPNLVSVLDFGLLREVHRPYFVMERLHGEDFAQHLAHTPICPARWIIPLFRDALDGLAAAHAAGIVHKDLKPANLFLDQAPDQPLTLRVTDFGIAHQLQRDRITQEGALACTPRYCPPEYLQSGAVLPASDVYQMGLVLAEALLGWPMVTARDLAAIVYAHATGTLALPPTLMASPVGEVLKRSLMLNPRQRYATAAEFRDALAALDLDAAEAAIELHRALYCAQRGSLQVA